MNVSGMESQWCASIHWTHFCHAQQSFTAPYISFNHFYLNHFVLTQCAYLCKYKAKDNKTHVGHSLCSTIVEF
jgi:hypothetical protein